MGKSQRPDTNEPEQADGLLTGNKNDRKYEYHSNKQFPVLTPQGLQTAVAFGGLQSVHVPFPSFAHVIKTVS